MTCVLSKRKSWSVDNVVKGSVPVKNWDPDKPFIQELIDTGPNWHRPSIILDLSALFADEPVILRHTVVDYWAARDAWTTDYLAKHIGLKQVCWF